MGLSELPSACDKTAWRETADTGREGLWTASTLLDAHTEAGPSLLHAVPRTSVPPSSEGSLDIILPHDCLRLSSEYRDLDKTGALKESLN